MKPLDDWLERSARRLARRTSRRSLLKRIGTALVGAAALPVLPVARAAAADQPKAPDDALITGDAGDPGKCEYWRNCGMDGFLCSCCGGSHVSCPPGTEMAPLTWIGTCRNPADGKDYIIAYNDCCGKSTCNRCMCDRNEGDMPNYYPAKSNDINWCMAATTNVYHCTTTILLGLAVEG
jgi:methylamine dehydrogenase light chain